MPRVMYVGLKEAKIDNVADTGLVWCGHGDIHSVSDEVWAKLSKHPDVWELAPDPAVEEATITGPGLSFVNDAGNYGVVVAEAVAPEPAQPTHLLETMSDDDLKDVVRARQLKVDLRKRGPALRAAVLEALKD